MRISHLIALRVYAVLLMPGFIEGQTGFIVAWIDYRNFPRGTISDVVSDGSEAISFICNNVVSFVGDPTKIYLMGQSAGAHIVACVLLEQALKESKGESTYCGAVVTDARNLCDPYPISCLALSSPADCRPPPCHVVSVSPDGMGLPFCSSVAPSSTHRSETMFGLVVPPHSACQLSPSFQNSHRAAC
uniref:protein-S-isoprenylcysteine alpha-carbonyl methylesterase n=1 Tax=Zea mays TaxID=4577 RepID=A0A804UCD9_MAIZE